MEIEPKSLTGKVLLQGIRALEESDGSPQASKYPDTPQGLKLFRDKSIAYLKSVLFETEEAEDIKNTVFPNVCSWCAYLCISRVTLHNYSKQGTEWADVIQEIKSVIVSVKSQLADHSKIPPMTWIFDATNNFDFFNTSEYRIDRQEPKEIRKALAASELPKLEKVETMRSQNLTHENGG